MRYIDLFGGVGGFRLGIDKVVQGKWKCVWYNDIDKYAVKVYNNGFKENYEPKDIREMDEKKIPEHDIICGGFPCQSFSIAGKRKGFEDTRGTLFFEICKIARFHRTKYLFLENVKGLLSHDKGETFRIILESLWKLGYDVEWQVLNSKNHGVPQNRERVFIIGHLGGFRGQQVFPLRESNENFNGVEQKAEGRGEGMANEVASAIDSNYWKGGRANRSMVITEKKLLAPCNFKHKAGDGMQTREHILTDIHPSLQAKPGHTQATYLIEKCSKVMTVQPILTPDRKKKGQHGRRFKEDGEPMFTLTAQDRHGIIIKKHRVNEIRNHGEISPTLTDGGDVPMFVTNNEILPKIRNLTPVEYERLQGFPDNWTLTGRGKDEDDEVMSDTQRYKMMGNAVTVNVVEDIVKKWIKIL